MRIAKFIHTLLVTIVTAVTVFTPAVAHAAAAPNLYFEQARLSAANGSNLSLSLHVNGNGTSLNTLNVVVSYPTDQLTFVGLDKTGSYFDTVIPAAPKASNGKVVFGVANLGKSTDSDVLVSTLLFAAKSAHGTATISLEGSEAANGGPAIAVTSTPATVTLLASNDKTASTLAISNILVSGITTSGAVVRWHTEVPASSSVDYGGTSTYGLTASAAGLTTDHVVPLAAVFSGRTIVHFKVTSVSADNRSGFSTDQAFTTQGYTLDIVVSDNANKPIEGAKVHVGDGKVVKTNRSGVATIENVAGGNQKVFVNDDQAQIITVKEVIGKNTSAPQQFRLVAEHSSTVGPTALLALLFVILAAVLFWAWRKRKLA
jgi:hypothetical protein